MRLFAHSLLLVLSIQTTCASSASSAPNNRFININEVVVRHRDPDESLDKFDLPLRYCQKPAKCQLLNYTTCMGAKLPYTSTTLNLTDLTSQEKVQEKLQLYQYLRYLPKCWAVIQPFLCALYMPKCENGMVDLPSREMCRITLGPCKIFYNSSIFPKFLNCDDDRIFPSKCKNDVHELKFNTTGYCMDPLVKTDQADWFYPDVEGCGLRCKDSLYTENEHYQIHKLTGYCVLLCGFFNLFTITTFIIDWGTANKYPALTIFYMNLCFLISYSGWSIQFLGGETREDIVCKKDGTLRKSEPSASENLSCVIVFVLVYYFLIAGMVWFVIFSYTWYMSSLQALGKIQERVDKKRAYFHLVAWSLPLILTITTMALGEIDGDFVTGICFVGMVSFAARTGLLLAPLAAAMIVAGYIIIRGLILLIKVKIDTREIISEHSSRKIRSNIVRMGVFALFMVIFCIITFFYHGYISVNTELWQKSLQNYIICKLTSLSSDFSHCKQESRPSVAMLQLQLLAVFGAGVAMASWVWCGATLHSWVRYIRKKFRCEVEEPRALPKHKIIAQAFAKRKKYKQAGRISFECQNYTDPVGLNFDLNSAASEGLNKAWAQNLARLVNRRGAMVSENAYSMSSIHQSLDSEVSLNVRHVSIESRCNSGDSQLSVQIAELKATRKVNGRRHRNPIRRRQHHHHHHHKHNDYRRNSKDVVGEGCSSSHLSNMGTKRESSTSLDSHLQLINALTNATCNNGDVVRKLGPNLQRRTANAGLNDSHHINSLLSNGKLVIPYLNNGNINGGEKSDNEDELSVTISESKFNMVLTNNLDLSDQLMLKSLKQDLHIEELDTCTDTDDDDERDVCLSGRESRISRKSKRSKRSREKYNNEDDNSNNSYDSESCPEIKELLQ